MPPLVVIVVVSLSRFELFAAALSSTSEVPAFRVMALVF